MIWSWCQNDYSGIINFLMGVENSINLIIVFKQCMEEWAGVISFQSLSCKIFNFQFCFVPDRIFVIKIRADYDM